MGAGGGLSQLNQLKRERLPERRAGAQLKNMIESIDEKPRIIDLTGPDGNAFVLLGYASLLAKKLGKDGKVILARMRSGDYENLVAVFDAEFGAHVTLYR